jgi:hypothetical protein
MPYSIHTKRLTPPRARRLTAAALLSGVLVAGCGGSSISPTGLGDSQGRVVQCQAAPQVSRSNCRPASSLVGNLA